MDNNFIIKKLSFAAIGIITSITAFVISFFMAVNIKNGNDSLLCRFNSEQVILYFVFCIINCIGGLSLAIFSFATYKNPCFKSSFVIISCTLSLFIIGLALYAFMPIIIKDLEQLNFFVYIVIGYYVINILVNINYLVTLNTEKKQIKFIKEHENDQSIFD